MTIRPHSTCNTTVSRLSRLSLKPRPFSKSRCLLNLTIRGRCPGIATWPQSKIRPFSATVRTGQSSASKPNLPVQSTTVSATRAPPDKPGRKEYHKTSDEPINLHSSTSYSVVVCAGIFIVAASAWILWDTNTLATTKTRSESVNTMTRSAPGHQGNLTAEQEEKLIKLWAAVLTLCGVEDAKDAPKLGNPEPERGQETNTESDATVKKSSFGFFRKAKPEDSTSSTNGGGDSADNDKYGLTKQYQQMLASHKPEELRQTIWEMIKHDHPDALLLRFLRARKWDVEKALVMFISALHWRHSKMKVDQDIMLRGEAGAVADEKGADAAANQLGHGFMVQCRLGKSFLHGIDKEGRPICVVRVRLHKSSDQSMESLERYTVHIIETARLALEAPVDTANIIFDMTGFTLANMDYHPVKFMIQCFEANYPESLGVVLVHNAPWVFQGIWRIIRGWLDPVVAAKVHFTNYRAGLEEFIDPSRIIEELGGDEDWEFKYTEPLEGENSIMEDTEARDSIAVSRQSLYREFEANTKRWIRHPGKEDNQALMSERDGIAAKLRDNYWQLDPYLRARSVYDRQGMIRSGGDIDWYRYQTSKPETTSGTFKAGDRKTG